MKKLIFILIFLGMGGLFSFVCGENFYFPECQVQISTPSGWYAFNATKFRMGTVSVSDEKINGNLLPSQAGLTVFCGNDGKMHQDALNTNQLAAKFFQPILAKFPATVQKDIYELETKLGKIKFLEIRTRNSFRPITATGVLKTDKGIFIVVLNAPSQKWDSFKPIFFEMVKNIRMCMTQRPGDIVVYSANSNVFTGYYKQRAGDQKEILLERFKKLKTGMSEAQYRDIMKYEWKVYEEQQKGANFTPGLVRTIPVSLIGDNYVDIYGVYNRCISEELFYVQITGGKIDNLELIERPFPDDFDIEVWENFLVGVMKTPDNVISIFKRVKEWSEDPKRILPAVERLEHVKIGMSEQEYLTIAKGFMVHFSLAFTYRIVPGVVEINIFKDPKEGLKREYLYASSDDEKSLLPKKVVVLDGKVASIILSEKKEPITPTLACASKEIKPGELIMVDFTAPEEYAHNAWVGIVPSHVPHGLETVNDHYDISIQYLKKRTHGTLLFIAPLKTGDYDFRMNNSDEGGKEVSSISFSIKASMAKGVTGKSSDVPVVKKPKLKKHLNPEYPKEALEARIQGEVFVEAVTDIYGRVMRAEAVKGPEMLRSAAVEAVKKWEYEPYLINGVPRPVKFTVKVKFSLNDKKKNG